METFLQGIVVPFMFVTITVAGIMLAHPASTRTGPMQAIELREKCKCSKLRPEDPRRRAIASKHLAAPEGTLVVGAPSVAHASTEKQSTTQGTANASDSGGRVRLFPVKEREQEYVQVTVHNGNTHGRTS